MATNEPLNDAASEIAAAEAALKAAQEKLEAVKAKHAGEDVKEALEPDEVETVEAIIVEELDDASEAAPKTPEAKEVTPEAAPAPEAVPTWVPYSTNQTPPAPDASSATVPPEGAANPAGYQPPTGYGAGYTAQQPHAGPGAVPPQQPYYGYQQPQYYQQPYGQPVISPKDHVAAGLLAIFLGWLGIHKFYLGYNTAGFIMLAVTILGSLFTLGLAGLVICVISVIEGILYLTKSQTEFEQIYVINKREWF